MAFNKSIRDANTANRIAMADARARAVKPLITNIQDAGVYSFNAIAKQLNVRGSTTSRGKLWNDVQVRRVIVRLKGL